MYILFTHCCIIQLRVVCICVSTCAFLIFQINSINGLKSCCGSPELFCFPWGLWFLPIWSAVFFCFTFLVSKYYCFYFWPLFICSWDPWACIIYNNWCIHDQYFSFPPFLTLFTKMYWYINDCFQQSFNYMSCFFFWYLALYVWKLLKKLVGVKHVELT